MLRQPYRHLYGVWTGHIPVKARLGEERSRRVVVKSGYSSMRNYETQNRNVRQLTGRES